MKTPPTASPAVAPPIPVNPADIAREAFRRLAVRRIAPTPDAYREIYNEVAGIVEPAPTPAPAPVALAAEPAPAPPAPVAAATPSIAPLGVPPLLADNPDSGAVQVMSNLAIRLADMPGELSEYGLRFRRLAKERDWDGYSRLLTNLLDTQLRKGSTLERMAVEAPETRVLRDMLSRTLGFAVPALLSAVPQLAAEAESLGEAVRNAPTETALQETSARLKQLCYQIELHSGDLGEQQELLLRLFRLLLDNVAELLDDDSWMVGQIATVRDLIAGPVDHRALEAATRSLKDVIYRQGKLKNSLSDVKLTVRNMMMTFVDRLASAAASTGDFQARMGGYAERISRAGNINELNDVLAEVVSSARQAEAEALEARDRMLAAQTEVQQAENRIRSLEVELRQMSELVREDHLTGSLNRRGLDEEFERERARADRRGTPLCVALLDVDNFKRLNDTYGHAAGDDALRHLVRVVTETLRTIDTVARYGGEEFLILMPETSLEAAAQTMTRLQRALTAHFFLHDNEKVLITFSCGVALRAQGEDQASLLKRADAAMYQAKQTGKNRVVIAS
jgi:diguanylate cyclase